LVTRSLVKISLNFVEASPIRESPDYGFMLRESGLFVYVMIEHQKKLNELDTRTSRLLNGSKPAATE